jgi:hypothetical protein
MKYRRLSPTGDYVFGFGKTSFYADADAVAQAIQTKLKLFRGEFWEDLDDGLPFFQQIAGSRDKDAIDLLIRSRILDAPNVQTIVSFSSTLQGRRYTAAAEVLTTFGTITVGVNP